VEVEENTTIGAGLLPSVRHYENPRRHRRAISDITHHPIVSVSVPMFPHLPSCCQHHQQQHHQQQQLAWGHAQVPAGRKSPSRFIVSLQRPAPVAVACLQPPSLWCQQPGRTLNEPMSHQPGISQQSATSNQRASNQPSKPALLPHKGPPSIGSIRALGHTLARDVKLTHCRSCPRGPPGDPRHLDYRIEQPLRPRTGCCRATSKPPAHYTNLLRLFSDRSVALMAATANISLR
jgi:hypothetical protein